MAADPTFREEHVLADGTPVTLRSIRPDDADAMRRGFGRLSPRSRYQRFLSGTPELTEDMVRYLTDVDGDRHVALVATVDSHDLKTEEGIGVARFVRLESDPEVAEAAVTVIDEAQSKGVGRLLLRALAKQAHAHGIRTIRAEVLAENTRMRHILEEVGGVVREGDGGTLVFDVPLSWPLEPGEENEAEHPLRRLLRAIAAFGRGATAAAASD